MASENLFIQIVGALFKQWLLTLLVVMGVFLGRFVTPLHKPWYMFLFLTALLLLVISMCRTLTEVFSLRKKETSITWCQISILIAFGAWIVLFLVIFKVKSHPGLATAVGVVGGVTSLIFQDTIRGVVAFLHLRLNHLLNIDDWIEVPKYNVDGEVKHVTLTTVTVFNWDTTTSTFPTSALHEDHFINYQKMTEGKTYGRLMKKVFLFDTRCIHPLSEEEAGRLCQSKEVLECLTGEVITDATPKELIEVASEVVHELVKEGMLNAQSYRLYIYHWLMAHPHVSQQPRLVVRWLEQTPNGLPLQLYAFITEGGLGAFEWQQSQIIEHVLKSLEWFGLRLYQSPTGHDVSNPNIHLVDAELNDNCGKEA